jgi:hypothetical protein
VIAGWDRLDILSNAVEVYKRECHDIVQRFLANKISFAWCTAALEAALADVTPRLKPDEITELRQLALANNAVVMEEMARRQQT